MQKFNLEVLNIIIFSSQNIFLTFIIIHTLPISPHFFHGLQEAIEIQLRDPVSRV